MEKLDTALAAGNLSEAAVANITSWLANDQVADFHPEINQLIEKEDWQTLNDLFYTQIEFGTAGIRGRTGLGSARINSWTVGTAAQGLADYITSMGEKAMQRGIILGSDTRLTSPEFVTLVGNVLTANGVTVYKFTGPRQVAMTSFAIRLHNAQAGVYISASHNPPTDNGVKIYWEDGAQVLPPHDKAITEAVKQVKIVKKEGNNALIKELGDDFDTVYRTRVLQESVCENRSALVVYSPFHGTGIYGVLPVLQQAGFTVIPVEEQLKSDGNFPNVTGGVPNPENRSSNDLTAKYLLEKKADLGITTDPDADRLGMIIPKDGDTVILDGHQTSALLAYFVASRLKDDNKLPDNGFMVRTFVTTSLLDAIANDFNLKIYNEAPVGFKFVGEIIKEKEDLGDELFIFGGEESFGVLKGSYARDKDASVAALLAAEMVSWLKDKQLTVWDLLNEIYGKYGLYYNDLVNVYFEGAEGFAKMGELMANLRANPPKMIGEWPVTEVVDRQSNRIMDSEGNETGKIEGHTANTLIFKLGEDKLSTVVVRPSGTEPKLKLYLSIYNAKAKGGDIAAVTEETKQQAVRLKEAVNQLAK